MTETTTDTATDATTLVGVVLTDPAAEKVSSLRGKVVSGVAAVAAEHARPCLVLAGRVSVGRRQAAAAGIEASYSLEAEVGPERALAHAAESLATLAEGVARQWSV